MSRKFISLVLALMLAVSMVTVAAVSVSAETDDTAQVADDGTCTYYFYMPNNSYWVNSESQGKAGYYYWGVNGAPSWPGYEATATDVANVFSATVSSSIVSFIWNNTVDGGDDATLPIHGKAAQTKDLGLDGYYEGDSDYYGDVDGFDGMIYVLNSEPTTVDDGGKSVWEGEWFYYYGNGEYGTAETKDALTGDDYYGKNGAFPTKVGSETTTTPDEVTESAALTVNSTSNYFPATSVKLDVATDKLTVTYKFSSAKAVLSTDWTLTYDSSVLEPAVDADGSQLNTLATVSPVIAAKGGASLELGAASEDGGTKKCVKLSASDLSLYDFSKDGSVYAAVTFDVLTDESAETTLDMIVNSLVVSELGSDGASDTSKEVALVTNKVIETGSTGVTTSVDTVITADKSGEDATDDTTPLDQLLSVSAESNYFKASDITVVYDDSNGQVTVTYNFSECKEILNTQWYLRYDPNILTVAKGSDGADQDVCPIMTAAGGTQVNLNDKADGYGYVRFIASDLGLYDYSEPAVFATVTFDVNDISGIAPVSTVVSLQVESLVVSEVDSEGISDESKEVTLVKNYKVLGEAEDTEPTTSTEETEETDATEATEATDATEQTVETSAATEGVTTAVETTAATEGTTTAVEPSTESSSEATPAEVPSGVSSTDTPKTSTVNTNGSAVQTGAASLSLVILAMLIGATGVMFVLRKKENM